MISIVGELAVFDAEPDCRGGFVAVLRPSGLAAHLGAIRETAHRAGMTMRCSELRAIEAPIVLGAAAGDERFSCECGVERGTAMRNELLYAVRLRDHHLYRCRRCGAFDDTPLAPNSSADCLLNVNAASTSYSDVPNATLLVAQLVNAFCPDADIASGVLSRSRPSLAIGVERDLAQVDPGHGWHLVIGAAT